MLFFILSETIYCLLFFFEGYDDHLELHVLTPSFPTRRSSDLHPFEDDKPAQAGKPGAQGPRKAMKPGTVDALIHRYKNAHAFLKLRKSTQKMYSENLEIISRWAGDVGVREIGRAHV